MSDITQERKAELKESFLVERIVKFENKTKRLEKELSESIPISELEGLMAICKQDIHTSRKGGDSTWDSVQIYEVFLEDLKNLIDKGSKEDG